MAKITADTLIVDCLQINPNAPEILMSTRCLQSSTKAQKTNYRRGGVRVDVPLRKFIKKEQQHKKSLE